MESKIPLSAPDLGRRVRIWPHQWIGLPFLFLLPLLALSGVFGEKHERISAASGTVSVEGELPSLLRYGQRGRLLLRVRNLAPKPASLSLALDPAYLERFAEWTFPVPLDARQRASLGTLAPGEEREFLAELKAEDYGRSRGSLVVSEGETELARLPLSTFVFP